MQRVPQSHSISICFSWCSYGRHGLKKKCKTKVRSFKIIIITIDKGTYHQYIHHQRIPNSNLQPFKIPVQHQLSHAPSPKLLTTNNNQNPKIYLLNWTRNFTSWTRVESSCRSSTRSVSLSRALLCCCKSLESTTLSTASSLPSIAKNRSARKLYANSFQEP